MSAQSNPEVPVYYDSKPCQVCGSEVRLEAKDPENVADIEEPDGPVGPEDGYVGGGDPTVDNRICTNPDCATNTDLDRADEV